jgi:hypothetical protein
MSCKDRDFLCSTTSRLLPVGIAGFSVGKRQRSETIRPLSSSVEVKDTKNFTSTSSVCLYSVLRRRRGKFESFLKHNEI